MNLDEAQRKKVSEWVEQGLKLSEIQSKVASEFAVSLTYMETRFLLDDLALKPKDQPAPPPAVIPPAQPAGRPPGQPETASGPSSLQTGDPLDQLEEDEFPRPPSSVSVTVDQITRPGAVASGKVTFSDAQTAEWYLDQMGRLGLVSKVEGYKPSQDDVMEFQMELQNALAKLGY
jgi:hypothetical protein